MNKSWKSRDQVVNKLWISYEKIAKKFCEKVINKFWTTSYKLWTSHEQIMNKSWKAVKNCETSHEQVVRKSKLISSEQVVNKSSASYEQVMNK